MDQGIRFSRLSDGKKVLPYSIERYEKCKKSKIQMVCEIVSKLPSPKAKPTVYAIHGLPIKMLYFRDSSVVIGHLKRFASKR